MTQFMCENGEDPLKKDTHGNTAYDMAAVVDDRELLPILEQRLRRMAVEEKISGLVELPVKGLIELPIEPLTP